MPQTTARPPAVTPPTAPVMGDTAFVIHDNPVCLLLRYDADLDTRAVNEARFCGSRRPATTVSNWRRYGDFDGCGNPMPTCLDCGRYAIERNLGLPEIGTNVQLDSEREEYAALGSKAEFAPEWTIVRYEPRPDDLQTIAHLERRQVMDHHYGRAMGNGPVLTDDCFETKTRTVEV